RNDFKCGCRPPGLRPAVPAGKARPTSNTQAVCEERATPPAGTAPRSPVGRSPKGRGGEGRVSALLPLLDDVRHRLRRGASHLPARRSRQNGNLFLREPLIRNPLLSAALFRVIRGIRGQVFSVRFSLAAPNDSISRRRRRSSRQ